MKYIKTPVNLSRLQTEINNAIIDVVASISCEGNEIDIALTRTLSSAEQATLDQLIIDHVAISTNELISARIEAAIVFANKLIIEFATENVMTGITQAGKTKIVVDYCTAIIRYMQSGSLYEAINEIDRLITAGIPSDLAPYITETRLLSFKQRIEAFLA